MKRLLLSLIALTLTACYVPVDAPPPPTPLFSATPPPALSNETVVPATSVPAALNEIPAFLTAVPENFNPTFCEDTRALQLLLDIQTAIQTRDGELFAAGVSSASGVGVRFIRDGSVITYFDNIKFIFETTYQADWGLGAGSGELVRGSFQEIVLPSLELIFASNPVITCNELKVGGATYIPEWPYNGMEYYSLHFPGTDEFGGLNWETWAVGMVREEGKPMLAALVHYAWEP
jgi:hypothetical protein